MFGLFCMSPSVSRLQHCGVLTHVDWTGLWVSKRPVVPAPFYLSFSTTPTPIMKLSLPLPAYRATPTPTPPPLPQPRPRTICGCHSRISNTKDLSLSTFLRFSCVFFHCCDLAVDPCSCHSLLHAATVLVNYWPCTPATRLQRRQTFASRAD